MNVSRLTKTKIFFLLGLLTITILGTLFLFQVSPNNTHQSPSSESLDTKRQQILTKIQNQLTANNLNENKLCQKLEEKYPTIIDLKNYLQTANSLEKLNTLYQEIQNAITYLWGINKKNEIGDPLAGIDLNGASRSVLLGLSHSAGDGNCFLNSFAVLLTGSQERDATKEKPNTQENVATRLRVAICLEIMKDYDPSESKDLKEFADNHYALDSESYALGKSPDTGGIIMSPYDDGKQGRTLPYKEPFVVYHVGSFHFEPLVCKKEGGTINFNYSHKPCSATSANNLTKTKVRALHNQNDDYTKHQFEGIKLENSETDGTKKTNRNIIIDIVEITEREGVTEEKIKEIIIDSFRSSYCQGENAKAELHFEFDSGLQSETEAELYDLYKPQQGKIIRGWLRSTQEKTYYSISLGKGTEVKEKSTKETPQIILTRSNELFIQRILEQEILEIKKGIIIIRHILRLPGLVSKVIVESTDPKLNLKGTCIGQGGLRIKSISSLINPDIYHHERIDIAA
ncbi:12249_t:CDS:2 [Ambispora leptoticha]|uniref:12249_t:CDS:1 n=1 Tax=Ambispora leptoticha TaxID=144679 RepID=A0A9N8Z296_9GLOM|nr:12249_t:CDS:2 [Ambispora leptoticha]